MPLDVALAGDVMLGRLVDAALADRPEGETWRRVLPLLADADAFVFNLECAVCGDLPMWEPRAKAFHFRLDPSHVGTLAASGVDAVLLANNHVMDHDVEGLLETIRHLDAAGIAHAGAGEDLASARAPALVRRSGKPALALVGAADHERAWAAGPNAPGIFLIDPADPASADAMIASAQLAREQGAGIVLAGLHWGPNMRRVPPPAFERFAQALLVGGFDLVWGTSAHLFQAVERVGEKAILYDLGDFVDDYRVDPRERNDVSFLYRVRFLDEARVDDIRMFPVLIAGGAVGPAPEREAEWAKERMRALCEPYGTMLVEKDGWLVLAEPHPSRRTRSPGHPTDGFTLH